jgi:tol-pal system protein YbgF
MLLAASLSGCVTVAEFRKLERQVMDLQRTRSAPSQGSPQLADTEAELDRISAEIRRLSGRLEEAEKLASDALEEAHQARTDLATRQIEPQSGPATRGADEDGAMGGDSSNQDGPRVDPPLRGAADEVGAYQSAHNAWRSGDHALCIDRFRKFLQTYPASRYADDSAFWMADCHFKQGDYKNAVLRFDDVVRNYPDGNKAADALFRQGESLLKLGPTFHEAAKRAFERVLTEYPESKRAVQANRQLDMMKAG